MPKFVFNETWLKKKYKIYYLEFIDKNPLKLYKNKYLILT